MWWMTLSSGPQTDDKDQQYEFTMQAELAEAIELMGWVKPALVAEA